MRFLIVNTDYPEFLRWLYHRTSGLAASSFEAQLKARNESLFGVADFYSKNLGRLGHTAWEVHANNEIMQRRWAAEHRVAISPSARSRHPVNRLSSAARRLARKLMPPKIGEAIWKKPPQPAETEPWIYEVLNAQIERFQPDVILNHDMRTIEPAFLRSMRRGNRSIVGQHAATKLPSEWNWSGYDLVLSSFPPTLQWCEARGLKSCLFRLAFEPGVLERLPSEPRSIGASFIGSLQVIHSTRTAWLEELCAKFAIDVWSPDSRMLRRTSPILRRFRGSVWGDEMYRILHQSRVTLNHHGNVEPGYANNMRLYEATGAGSLLLTDWKSNLAEMFEPSVEVAAYHSTEECGEMIERFSKDTAEAERIAAAGQARTLRDHTYFKRMQELVQLVS